MATTKVLGLKFESPAKALKQMGFAGSRALNDAAHDARKAMVRALPKHFTIRNKFTAAGFRVKPSRKGSNPVAILGTTREYMRDQIVGGTRTRTAVPSDKLRGGKKRRVGRKRWPRALRAKGRHFVVRKNKAPRRLRGGLADTDRVVLRRMGRGGKRIRFQWRLRQVQKVRARFPFQRIAFDTVKQTLPDHFRRWIKIAARTAK